MNSGEEQGGVRRKSKKRKSMTLRDLMTPAGWHQAQRENPEFVFLAKWGYPVRVWNDDPQVLEIMERLDRFWPGLSAADRQLYLQTAESVAEAEKARRAWNPKASRKRFIQLAKTAVWAAKLANALSELFPPPLAGESAPLWDLMGGLGSFVAGVVAATVPIDTNVSARKANQLVKTTKQRLQRKARGINWELVRDLAWLASGKKITLDERAVRRYLEKVRSTTSPAKKLMVNNWELIRTASRLASAGGSDVFEGIARVYFKVP